MQRLGTRGRGKTLKTSPARAVAAAAGTVFRAKTPGLGGTVERGKICAHSFWYFRPIWLHSG